MKVDLADMIGTPYVYGETDCIHLVLTALDRMGIEAPDLNRDWYEMPARKWGKDLIRWGMRIDTPAYDGDVIVCPDPIGFSVVWNDGALLICKARQAVHWLPLSLMSNLYCRTSDNSSRFSVFRSRNIGSLQQK